MLHSPAYLKIEHHFAVSPEQTMQTTPDYTASFCNAETPFDSTAMASPNDDGQAAYMTPQSQADSLWGATARTQAGGDDFDNYALHSSPAAGGLPSHVCSNPSSPRSWGSQDQFRSVSWGTGAGEPQSVNFVQGSPAPLPPNNTCCPSGTAYLNSQFDMYQTLPDQLIPASPCGSAPGYKADHDLPSSTAMIAGDEDDDNQSNNSDDDQDFKTESSVSAAPSPAGDPVVSCRKNSAAKAEEPYAQLIYRAFLSNKRHAMTLKEIYQWFLQNTQKGKSGTKGWQNSIRHNLSMNHAFTKRDRPIYEITDEEDEGSGSGASDALCSTPDRDRDHEGSSSKKGISSEWFLEDWALQNGVQSTTRYRKGPSRRRSPATKTAKRNFSRDKPGFGSGSRSRRRNYTTTRNLFRESVTPAPPPPAAFPSHYLPQNHHLLSSSHHHGHHSQSHSQEMVLASGRGSGNTQTAPTYLDYASFHPHNHHYGHVQSMARMHSDSGIDQPITPEPYAAEGVLLPDLRGAPSTTASGGGGYLSAAGIAVGVEADLYGLSPATPVPAQAPTVVYDEMVDRYGGGWGGTAGGTAAGGGGVYGHGHGHGHFHGRY